MQESQRGGSFDFHTPKQIAAVCQKIGVHLTSSTATDFLGYCPFHSNRHSPAFAISKSSGTFHCFSPECGESGSLLDLVTRVGNLDYYQSLRLILNSKEEDYPLEEIMNNLLDDRVLEPFDQELLDRLYSQLPGSPGYQYMHSRGFEDETLKEFQIGYSVNAKMVTVPLHDEKGMPLGFIGRSIDSKVFKNSTGLPKRLALFNLHRAKRSPVCYLHEASFDAMSTAQAGYDGAVATMGNISSIQLDLLDRYFETIVIMTDFDDKTKHIDPKCRKHGAGKCPGHNPGRDLGYTVAERLAHKDIMWGFYGEGQVFPPEKKDTTDCDNFEIRQMIEGRLPTYIYSMVAPY